MAKVKNQSIPTDEFEENLDPPIALRDQYRRGLSEGIDHPKLPAGQEIVTFSKKESRPAQRDKNKYFNKPKAKEHRKAFSDCAWCWHNQVFFDFMIDPCHSAGSRHYVTPWEWIPGAQNTAYNKFMQECLDYEKANPGIPFPRCSDIKVYPSAIDYCPGDKITFTVFTVKFPVTIWADAGTCGPGLKWTAPATREECPSSVKVSFQDVEERKACYDFPLKPIEECCCEELPGFALVYLSLQMQCNESQAVSIDPDNPGCPPYTWELSGGGTLTRLTDESYLYEAPASNPDCANNPTITVTDKCGEQAFVKFAVNCSLLGVAFWQTTYVQVSISTYCPDTLNCRHVVTQYNCNGTINHICEGSMINPCLGVPCSGIVAPLCDLYAESYLPGCFKCGDEEPQYTCVLCSTWECEGQWSAHKTCEDCSGEGNDGIDYHGHVCDKRSQFMKDAGCCPINLETGLPF
jgi:hypothetical protein